MAILRTALQATLAAAGRAGASRAAQGAASFAAGSALSRLASRFVSAIKTKVTTPGIDRMTRTISRDPRLRQEIGVKWTRMYRRFIRSRYYFYSRKQGTWPHLSERRVRQKKRSGRDGRSMGILRHTNRLFNSTKPELGDRGLIQVKVLKTRMRLIATMDGPGQYPDGTRLSTVAEAHQVGRGHLPVRQILVPPDKKTEDEMEKAAHKITVKHLKRAQRR